MNASLKHRTNPSTPYKTYHKSVVVLREGHAFGEIALLDPSVRRTASVATLEWCDLIKLTRRDLMDILPFFPKERKRIKKYAEKKIAHWKMLQNKEMKKLGPRSLAMRLESSDNWSDFQYKPLFETLADSSKDDAKAKAEITKLINTEISDVYSDGESIASFADCAPYAAFWQTADIELFANGWLPFDAKTKVNLDKSKPAKYKDPTKQWRRGARSKGCDVS